MPREQDSVSKIVEYLEKNLKKGYKIEELKWALVTQKHSKIEIDKALAIINARTAKAKKDEEDKLHAMSTASVIEEEVPVHKPGFFKRILGKLKNN